MDREKRIRVFVASPGDVEAERDAVSMVVSEINRILGPRLDHVIETVRWETDARPAVGEDAQDVINSQIGEYDIFVGIMWRRFGTRTRRAESGTSEEFERALGTFRSTGRPVIMFYFRTEPFYTTDKKELHQFLKVAKFQDSLRGAGVLYWNYSSPLQFERNVREHLMRQLLGTPSEPRAAEPAGVGRVAAATGHAEIVVSARGVGFASQSIFLSYFADDRDRALSLYRELVAVGHRVWMDVQDLLPGQIWYSEVEHALSTASVYVVLTSAQSVNSRGSFAKENQLARKKKLRVIPVRLDSSPLPDELADLQAVDLFRTDGLTTLLQALQRPPEP